MDKDELTQAITLPELMNAVKVLKNNKTCGEDKIQNDFIKLGREALHKAMVQIFNILIMIKWTPPAWNKKIISILHKRGRKTS